MVFITAKSYIAAVRFDGPACDGQAQAGATPFSRPRLIDAVKTVEDIRLVFGGDSPSLVDHLQEDLVGFPFHPSFAGLVLLLGCAAALYLTVRWSYKKYPYLSYKHAHTVFEGEAAMAAENARIEAEARELVKKRPYGPWLFR